MNVNGLKKPIQISVLLYDISTVLTYLSHSAMTTIIELQKITCHMTKWKRKKAVGRENQRKTKGRELRLIEVGSLTTKGRKPNLEPWEKVHF